MKLQCPLCGTQLPSEVRFALAIRAKRAALSFRAAAQECGVSAPTLCRLEAGGKPSTRDLYRLCRWIGYDANTALREYYGTEGAP